MRKLDTERWGKDVRDERENQRFEEGGHDCNCCCCCYSNKKQQQTLMASWPPLAFLSYWQSSNQQTVQIGAKHSMKFFKRKMNS
jgi:hypothetical protein